MLVQLGLYILSFGALWFGSGLVVDSIKLLAQKVHVPYFAFSFFVLGLLTSVPEFAVGINALTKNQPEIFVGNLLGGVIVIFLLVIPLLAVLSKKVYVQRHLSNKNLLLTLGIIAVPALFTLDQTVTNLEGFILIGLYIVMVYIIKVHGHVLSRVEKVLKKEEKKSKKRPIVSLLFGVGLVFIASRFIVEQTIAFSEMYQISTFIVSLTMLAIGTNLPEITLALRSLTKKSENIAMGSYLGSAASNTLLFGIFTLLHNGEVVTAKAFTLTFFVIVGSLLAFYVITHKKSILTRREGILLLACYIAFLLFEATQVS